MAKYLTAKEVAEMYGLTEYRVYQLVREKLLPAIRFGRQIRFSPDQLAEFEKAGGQAYPGIWRREV